METEGTKIAYWNGADNVNICMCSCCGATYNISAKKARKIMRICIKCNSKMSENEMPEDGIAVEEEEYHER